MKRFTNHVSCDSFDSNFDLMLLINYLQSFLTDTKLTSLTAVKYNDWRN